MADQQRPVIIDEVPRLEIVAGWRQRAGLRDFFNEPGGEVHIDSLTDRAPADGVGTNFIVAVILDI